MNIYPKRSKGTRKKSLAFLLARELAKRYKYIRDYYPLEKCYVTTDELKNHILKLRARTWAKRRGLTPTLNIFQYADTLRSTGIKLRQYYNLELSSKKDDRRIIRECNTVVQKQVHTQKREKANMSKRDLYGFSVSKRPADMVSGHKGKYDRLVLAIESMTEDDAISIDPTRGRNEFSLSLTQIAASLSQRASKCGLPIHTKIRTDGQLWISRQRAKK